MKKFKNWIAELVYMLINEFGKDLTNVTTILTEDIFQGSYYAMASQISDILKVTAFTIIGICFLIDFLRTTMKIDMLKIEDLLRVMIKFVFARVCIEGADVLMKALYAQATEWINSIGNIKNSLPNVASNLKSQIKDGTFWEAVAFAVSCLIIFIAVKIIGLLIKVIAYARMFEILTYIAVAPIPCAFLPLGEQMGGGRIPYKFFMNFFAACLQGVIIIIAIRFYFVSIEGIGQLKGDTMKIAFELIFGALILVITTFKSGSIAKSLLDVG